MSNHEFKVVKTVKKRKKTQNIKKSMFFNCQYFRNSQKTAEIAGKGQKSKKKRVVVRQCQSCQNFHKWSKFVNSKLSKL